MTDQTNQVSLEEVRVRFLDAEARLSEAATAVGAIQDAADRLGAAREGLGAASLQLGELAGSMNEVASSLTDNATHLREGVDAIRAGDPAEIKRQIEELDAAFTAMQSVVGERLTVLETQGTSLAAQLVAIADGQSAAGVRLAEIERQGSQLHAAMERSNASFRQESRVVAIGLAILVIAAIVVGLLA